MIAIVNIKSMLEILKYTTSGFCVFIGSYALIALVLYFGVNGIVRLCTRLFRMITVLFRDWPPSHLDADGDWKESSN